MNTYFDFYGIRMTIDSGPFAGSESFFVQVMQSFEYFQVESLDQDANIQIQLTGQDLGLKSKGLFSFRHATAYGFKSRVATYPFQHAVKLQRKNSNLIEAELHGREPRILKELLFQLINSLVGWELEKKGWQRLHAASFVENGSVRVLFLPSGGGKSYLTTKSIQRGHTCFSDEITLIDTEGQVRPWPIPIQLDDYTIDSLGLRRTKLIEFPKMAFAPKYQFYLQKNHVSEKMKFDGLETPLGQMSFLFSLVTGWGLPQIIEWNLRLDTLGEIFSIFKRRTEFGLKLLMAKQLRAWTITDDRKNSCGAVHISKSEVT